MFWEDMAYNAGPLLSPALYRRYCLPFYETLVGMARQQGVQVVMLDSDGDVHRLMPLWLDVGIHVMHPMEVAAGMDVRETRRQYGTRVAFLGHRQAGAGPGTAGHRRGGIPKVRAMLETGGGLVGR